MRMLTIALLALGLSGCLADVLVSTAVQGELQAKQASAAQQTLNKVTNDTGMMNLQRAVDAYAAEQGVNPKSLDVLIPGILPEIPKRADGGDFGYNPVTGKVLKTDEGPSAADFLLMEDITTAINAYGTASGYYPPTLDALSQAGYLSQLPRTEGGLEFGYDQQTGVFTHPLDGHVVSAQRPAPAAGGGGGGGGPMGEAMTGIAMQEQLNSNSNAGVSSARGNGASGISRATNTQNQQQEEALKDLGF